MSLQDLERLKRANNPQEEVSMVEQCELVGRILEKETIGNQGDLADYLGKRIKKAKISKMNTVYLKLIPELKNWFSTIDIGVATLYDRATESEKKQREYLKNARLLGS